MMTLRLHDKRDLRLHDEPAPRPAEDELLLDVTAVGLCGSDLHWFTGAGIGDAVLTRPLVLGHEFVGTVAAGERAGERVALEPAIACGRCAPCRRGDENLCVSCRFAGHSTDGALRTAMTWPARLAFPVPADVTDAEAALLEPLGVALHALDVGHVTPGAAVGVFGCGPLGLLIVQLLRNAGALSIVATDPFAHRVEAAEAFGATVAVQTRRAGMEILPRSFAETGLDVAFEVAGDDDAVATALNTLRPGGRLVLVGIPEDDRTSFTASVARRKGLTISLCRRMKPSDLPRAIRVAEENRVELASLVSARFALSQWQDAFEMLSQRRALKVVIEPQRDAA